VLIWHDFSDARVQNSVAYMLLLACDAGLLHLPLAAEVNDIFGNWFGWMRAQ